MPTYMDSYARTSEVLKQRFGHDGFLPMQEEVIKNVLSRRDSLVLMPTGSGKSVCYQLPALVLDGLTLVISPLIALMKDQVDALKSKEIRAAFINSTMTYATVQSVQMDAYRGYLDILYVAPERLVTRRFNDFLHSLKLSLVAIDEAHCISEWGHDFRPDYRNLQTLRDDFPNAPVIALTATATERVREDILYQLRMTDATRFVASFNRPNLTYHVRPKRRSFEALVEILRGYRDGSAIIYRFSRQDTEALASRLSSKGFKALPYHAGLEDNLRRETQERFLSDEVPIIVATIAFGMGVDKPNIRLVVHYDLPKTIEGYYQETGRAGRDGQPSECVLFFSYRDKMKQDFFIDQIGDDSERTNAKAKLAKMVEYGNAKSCRRVFLLEYFGEEWLQENCGACDICLAEDRRTDSDSTFDGTELAQKVLSAVIRTGQRFGANHIVGVLRGSRSRRVLELRHDELSVHGITREMTKDELQDTVDQLVDIGLIARASGKFPTLFVTSQGREFLRNRHTVALVRGVRSPSPQDGSDTESDSGLFEKLRVLRKELADALSVPAFVVFSDATLRQMASTMPRDRSSLLEVKGVGESQLQQFGDQFISAIAGYMSDTKGETARIRTPVGTAPISHGGLPNQTEDPPTRVPTPVEKLLSRVVDHPVTVPPEDTSLHRTWHSELGKVLATLYEREAHVLSRRFGLEDDREHTLQEIGESLNISRKRVRHIEEKALRKLRHPSRLKPLKALLEANTTSEDGSDSSDLGALHIVPKSGSYVEQVRKSHTRAYEPWSPDEDQQLNSLYESGRSISEIASKLERQPSAIRSRLKRSGLIPQNGQSHLLTLDLVRTGLNIAEIAQRRGIAEQTVLTHLERLADERNVPDLSHLMPKLQRYERIARAFVEAGDGYLKPIKESLGDDYSYEELRLVRMWMRQSP